ncbi:MAG TPA: hypothetical protein VD884_09230 [Ohtaekwangia sp.]|nr:hypothetical protein [Ohtaekwangia sp.]
MKKTIFILLSLVSLTTYAQEIKTSSVKTGNEKDRFTCQHLELTPDNKKVFLRENVTIKTDNLFLKADSAVFDNENQTLVAYGTKEFVFRGGETVVGEQAKSTVRYKLRDKIIYVE